MKIKHAVLTSVDRDDLKDMGSILGRNSKMQFAEFLREQLMETLIPDFQGIHQNTSIDW